MNTPQEVERSSYLKEWGFDVATFEAKAKQSLENARGDLSELTGVLRQTMGRTKQIVLDLQKSREPVATELRKGFERAWDDIEEGFTRARRIIRESKTVPVGGDLSDNWVG